jgi:hypothetical protein
MKITVTNKEDDPGSFVIDLEGPWAYRASVKVDYTLESKERLEKVSDQLVKEITDILKFKINKSLKSIMGGGHDGA